MPLEERSAEILQEGNRVDCRVGSDQRRPSWTPAGEPQWIGDVTSPIRRV